MADLDAYLQLNILKPSVPDPSGSGVTFDHRWSQETYSNFRTRLHDIALEIDDAYHETDLDTSVAKWQALLGAKFEPPAPSSSGGKFGSGGSSAAVGPSTGRMGRAG